MIELRDDLLFAEGGRRYCFVCPDDPSKCVKVLSPNGDPKRRRRESVWYKKLRPLSMFDDNLRELKSFDQLAKKGDDIWDHFPRCYGIQPTNRGDGIVTDLIRDADGAVSKTVKQYIKASGKTPELLAALESFFDFFRCHLIITRDILYHNLVVRSGSDGLTIFMIDGFGSSELIPVSRWSRGVGLVKVERKIRKFRQRYKIGQ